MKIAPVKPGEDAEAEFLYRLRLTRALIAMTADIFPARVSNHG